MSLLAVVPRQRNQNVEERLQAAYSNDFSLSSTCFIVDDEAFTGDVARKIGLTGGHRVASSSGAAFELGGGYSGHATGSLWEWLRKHEEKLYKTVAI